MSEVPDFMNPGPRATSQFSLQVAGWKKRALQNMDRVVQEGLKEVCRRIVADTPVASGQLKRSWYAGLNSVPTGTMGGGGNNWEHVISQVRAGDRFYFINVAPYARRIEYGFVGTDKRGRSYNQTGQFFMRRHLVNFHNIMRTMANRVARREAYGQPNRLSGANVGRSPTLSTSGSFRVTP